MNQFDPKTLLNPPDEKKVAMSVNDLAAKLAKIKSMGLGEVSMRLPDGVEVIGIDLVASGEAPAHFVLQGEKTTK